MSEEENIVVPLDPGIQTKLTPLLDFTESFTGMVMAPNDNRSMYLLQQSGIIFRYDQIEEDLDPVPLLDLREEIEALYRAKPNKGKFSDERGLLGLAFHPAFNVDGDYFQNTFIVMHSEIDNPDMYGSTYRDQFQQDIPNPDHMNCISMYRIEDDPEKTKATRRDILCIPHPQMNHNGGGLVFDSKGYLWIGIGDGGGANDEHGPLLDPNDPTSFLGNAQNIHSLHGKLLRIHVNPTIEGDETVYYSIPMGYPRSENPFAPDRLGNPARPQKISPVIVREFPDFVKNHPETTRGLPEIANWGFRNPWRMFFDGDDLYVADVGQDKFESIKLVRGFGGNYLWRGYEGFSIFNEPAADYAVHQNFGSRNLPIIAYGREMGIATVGAGIYRGSRIPSLAGKLIIADYSGRIMISTPPATKKIPSPGKDLGQEWPLSTLFKLDTRIHSLAFDNEGEAYFLTFDSKTKVGQFLRLDLLDQPDNLDQPDRVDNPSSTKEELTEEDVLRIVEQAAAKAYRIKSLLRRVKGQSTSTKMHIAIMVPDIKEAKLVYSHYDAWAGSVDIAKRKAYTAFAFSSNENALTTRTIQALTQLKKGTLTTDVRRSGTQSITFEDIPLFQIGNSNPVGGIIEFPGGVPLYKNGVLVGAIGVSGDGVDQDETVARAGAFGYEAPEDIRADTVANLPYYGQLLDELD